MEKNSKKLFCFPQKTRKRKREKEENGAERAGQARASRRLHHGLAPGRARAGQAMMHMCIHHHHHHQSVAGFGRGGRAADAHGGRRG